MPLPLRPRPRRELCELVILDMAPRDRPSASSRCPDAFPAAAPEPGEHSRRCLPPNAGAGGRPARPAPSLRSLPGGGRAGETEAGPKKLRALPAPCPVPCSWPCQLAVGWQPPCAPLLDPLRPPREPLRSLEARTRQTPQVWGLQAALFWETGRGVGFLPLWVTHARLGGTLQPAAAQEDPRARGAQKPRPQTPQAQSILHQPPRGQEPLLRGGQGASPFPTQTGDGTEREGDARLCREQGEAEEGEEADKMSAAPCDARSPQPARSRAWDKRREAIWVLVGRQPARPALLRKHPGGPGR